MILINLIILLSYKNVDFFVLNIKDADIAKLEDAIIKTQNIEFIQKFVFDIKGVYIKKLKNAIEKIKTQLDEQKTEFNNISDYEYLKDLLKTGNYVEIEKNREKYSALFKNENIRTRTLKK